jgi:hypothetical protein
MGMWVRIPPAAFCDAIKADYARVIALVSQSVED